MPSITLEAVGAQWWFNNNAARVEELGLARGDYYCKEDDILDLAELTGVSLKKLKKYGRKAMMRGCYLIDSTRTVVFTNNMHMVKILRDIHADWAGLDGTILQDEDDNTNRFLIGPSWSENSSAVDVILVAAIQLDLGRVQLDQCGTKELVKPNGAAQMLRDIVGTFLWSKIDMNTRNNLRDGLMAQLEVVSEGCYTTGQYAHVTDLVAFLFDGFAQCSWTESSAVDCCGTGPAIYGKDRATRFWAWDFTQTEPPSSISAVMNASFRQSIQSADFELQCDDIELCGGAGYRYRVVLDRMPPTLIVRFTDIITQDMDKDAKLFEKMRIRYYDTTMDQPRSTTYQAIGAIFSQPEEEHYFVRWDRSNEVQSLIHYDSAQDAHLVTVDDWFEGVEGPLVGVCVLFLRQISDK